MKSAHKEKLQTFFQNNFQYEIPFFQRSYVWNEENWELLLEHLQEEVENYKNQVESEHFIGTIITKPLPHESFNTNPHELIDGQQRLTTIAIIIKALADTSTGEYKSLKDNLLKYLSFKDSQDNTYYRVKHSKNDSPFFERIMKEIPDEKELLNINHNIVQAYLYFYKAFKPLTDSDRDIFANVLLNKLPVIAMFLSEEDDEQEIFDTINSLGVRLTISELLKNYIFRETDIRNLYDDYWFKIFESEEEDIDFWNTNKTAGRVKRTNLELLLYCFLIIETGSDVRLEKLFFQYKKYLKDKSIDEKKQILQRLRENAVIYRNFPSINELNEILFTETEKRVFHVIENLEITTVYPLLLIIYTKVDEVDERNRILEILESYLVRRMVIKLTAKNYNRFFIQLINDLKKETSLTSKVFSIKLLSFTEDTNRFPGNNEFKGAILNNYLYNKYVRELLLIIALYQMNNKLNDIRKLSFGSYSVEHIMPKKWREHWNESKMTEEDKSNRDWQLKTMGNLTLITNNLNSKMRNSAWATKRVLLKKYSLLSITTPYLEIEKWDEPQIKKRANDLANTALEIWKKPIID